jgi:nuclear transport factor 2 (NTF2) superfamily protein
MHPYVREELARQREQELRRSAGRYRPPQQRHRRHGAARYRAGWVLIEIGLALAQRSAMAGTWPVAARSSTATLYAGNRPDSHPAKEA